jgi:hypothetical protein
VPSTLKGGTSFLPSSNSSSPHQHRIGKVEALLLAMPTVKSEVRLKLVRTYYDTPSLALHRERLSFRVRKQGSEFVQTIKAENPTQADILERKEWEDQIPSKRPALDAPKTGKDPRRLVRSLDRCQVRLLPTRSANTPDFPACRKAQHGQSKCGCW